MQGRGWSPRRKFARRVTPMRVVERKFSRQISRIRTEVMCHKTDASPALH